MAKKNETSKAKMLNYLYGLKCDLQWERQNAMNEDRCEDYIAALNDEETVVAAIIAKIKSKG